ncbi:RloB family protein [Candidatus Poriferisodalis sp.]|uniref:RloB family protein n=1 Tax=Candidatus Poriferisodalis sp. TaxID=3101277 RepID=UPI003B02BA09
MTEQPRRPAGRTSGLDRRKRTTRRPKSSVLIMTEGRRTEPDYLAAIAELPHVRQRFDIQIDPSLAGRTPIKIVTGAARAPRRNQHGGEGFDSVWCVFDVEQPRPHPSLMRAVNLARDNDIDVAISNPCFEAWLIFHWQRMSQPMTTAQAVSLRQQLDGAKGKRVDGSLYLPMRQDAADHARRLAERHSTNGRVLPDDNPSSGMFTLLDALSA